MKPQPFDRGHKPQNTGRDGKGGKSRNILRPKHICVKWYDRIGYMDSNNFYEDQKNKTQSCWTKDAEKSMSLTLAVSLTAAFNSKLSNMLSSTSSMIKTSVTMQGKGMISRKPTVFTGQTCLFGRVGGFFAYIVHTYTFNSDLHKILKKTLPQPNSVCTHNTVICLKCWPWH